MSNTILNARITDSRVELSNLVLLSSGSVNAVQIRCEFCALWDGYTKTAVFYRDKKRVYHALITDGLATIPREVLADEGTIFFGIMGVKDNTRTTEAVRLEVVQGAITIATAQTDPTPDIYQQLLASYNSMENALAFERQRLDQLIAMSPAPGTLEYTINDGIVEGVIRSNGTSAYIEVRATSLNLDQGDYYYCYGVPTHLAPLTPVALTNSVPNEMEVSLYVDENGQLILQYRNLKSAAYEFSYIFASATFPLAVVSIPEVIDARLGANGRTYHTAGDSIRGQVNQMDEKMSAVRKRVTNLEQGILPSPFETDSAVAYQKVVPERALPFAEVSKVGGMTRKCTNLVDIPDKTASGTHAYYSVLVGDFKLPAGEYTISAKYTHNGAQIGAIDVRTYGSSGASLGIASINPNTSGSTSKTFTVPNGVEGIRVYLYSNITATSGETSVTISDVMLNEGSTALPYEPYFEGLRSAPVEEVESVGANLIPYTLPIPSAVQALDGYGDGVNESVYNYIDWEKKQFVKRVKKISFIGYEPWVLYATNQYVVETKHLGIKPSSKAICSHFNESPDSNAGTFFVGTAGIAFNSSIGTMAEWKQYLADQAAAGTPLDVVYELETPEITDLSNVLTEDNFIGVAGGGSVTFKNEHDYDVPSEITFQIKGANA